MDTVISALGDSFANDPMLNWVIPEPSLYPAFFRLIVTEIFLPRGIVHLEDGGRAAALWLPPGEHFDLPPRLALLAMVARLILRRGPRVLRRIREQGRSFDGAHPKMPHYYLQFIGCRPPHQGRGLGSALLKQGLLLADQDRMPAYLESSRPENIPLYQRHGFEVVTELKMPDGPSAWPMWREARGRG